MDTSFKKMNINKTESQRIASYCCQIFWSSKYGILRHFKVVKLYMLILLREPKMVHINRQNPRN